MATFKLLVNSDGSVSYQIEGKTPEEVISAFEKSKSAMRALGIRASGTPSEVQEARKQKLILPKHITERFAEMTDREAIITVLHLKSEGLTLDEIVSKAKERGKVLNKDTLKKYTLPQEMKQYVRPMKEDRGRIYRLTHYGEIQAKKLFSQ